MNCPELTQKYQELLSLQEDFLVLFDEFKKTEGQMSPSERLKKIEELNPTKEKIDSLLTGFKSLKFKIAKKIMNQGLESGKTHCFGPEEVEKAFGIKINPEDIPPIPFSKEELQRANELGQFLVLRTDKAPDGRPLTMKKLAEIVQEKFDEHDARELDEENKKGKVLYPGSSWFKEESFYTGGNDTFPVDFSYPSFGWALATKGLMPNSTDKNYFEQVEEIAKYLETEVFKGEDLPKEFKEAIDELNVKKEQLKKLFSEDKLMEYEMEMSNLKMMKFLLTPVEVLYDISIYFQNNNERLFNNRYTWTYVTNFDGDRIHVGGFNSGSVGVSNDSDDCPYANIGLVFSRKS